MPAAVYLAEVASKLPMASAPEELVGGASLRSGGHAPATRMAAPRAEKRSWPPGKSTSTTSGSVGAAAMAIEVET